MSGDSFLQFKQSVADRWQSLREALDDDDAPGRVAAFREKATRLLLIEQWVLLVPVAITAYYTGNSWMGVLVVGGAYHLITSASRHADPIGLTTRSLIATGLLLDILLLIYALTGTGSLQMDGGHMWVFAILSHCLGLLCWRSLLITGTLVVLHHFVLVLVLPLWVYPDGASIWRVVLHAAVVFMQLSVLCVFIFFIKRMFRNAEELERALAQSLAMVEKASRSKSQFLAHMSHELRTPLNAIIGFSDIMKSKLFGELSPRYSDYAEKIHASGAHLHALINDVLDLSRVESGKYELYEEVLDPAEIVETCLAMISARAKLSGIELLVSMPGERYELLADARVTKQILLNLLSNAIKYTRSGGTVMVSLKPEDGDLVLSVTDTGCGIGEADLDRIFQPFERGDSLVASRTEGTGLGLAISRHFMLLHGGTLELKSELNVGTAAIARFPAERVRSAQGDTALKANVEGAVAHRYAT